MKTLVRSLSFSLASIVGMTIAQCEQELALTELIASIEPSVVRIDVGGPQGEGIGSGFVVDRKG